MPSHLEFTDARFTFAGKSYPGVPLLVDSNNEFVRTVCEYFQHLVVWGSLKASSAKTYGDHFVLFWNYLEERPLNFRLVGDKDLLAWLNAQEIAGVSDKTRCARCDAIFDFYVWLECNGHVQHSVRVPGWNDSEKFVPLLTAVPARSSGPHIRRASKNGIVSAVRPRAVGTSPLATPTFDDVTKLYIAAHNDHNEGLTERNHLLIDWYSQVGLRRHEWNALTVSQIPPWDAIYDLQQRNEAYELRLVKTKGGRIRHVGVIPELLEKTREYIESTRMNIVARFKAAKGNAYKAPDEIFLSEKTGQPLTLTSITNSLTGWFRIAGVDGHGHRLRAAYLTNLFEAELAAEEARLAAHPGTKAYIDYELVLRKVAERAGHADIESLRPYLTLARKRRVRDPGLADPVTLQLQVDARKQELALLEHRIAEQRAELQLIVANQKSTKAKVC